MDSLSVMSVTIKLEWDHLIGILVLMLCMLSLLECCTLCEPFLGGLLMHFFEFFCLYGAQEGVKSEFPFM